MDNNDRDSTAPGYAFLILCVVLVVPFVPKDWPWYVNAIWFAAFGGVTFYVGRALARVGRK